MTSAELIFRRHAQWVLTVDLYWIVSIQDEKCRNYKCKWYGACMYSMDLTAPVFMKLIITEWNYVYSTL
jgi:hypothetical protein